MSKRLASTQDYSALVDAFDTWLFDCDGVIWHGDRLIDGAIDVLNLLRQKQKHIIFVTNNATKSRRSYKSKFDKLGVQADVNEIFGSAYAAAVYVSSVMKLPKDKKVYVIGEAGLEEELHDEGITTLGGTDPADNVAGPFSLSKYEHDPSVAAVVCGLDTSITYTKYCKAYQHLTRNPGCAFVVTNEDGTYPAGDGILPGGGAVSSPLRYALKRDPIAIGKPNKTMLDTIQAKHHFDPKRTIMVGDRLDTDILFGQLGGVSTLLVLTGVTLEGDITGPDASPVIPDYVTPSIGDLRQAA
ncbi:2-phosphoglycolate phosphatase [Exidia glandulosa HHB12029]|uniref:4-nitrophenylphosphatase n=1 Tax=Exidia glandulosa HHB12029 TaxID=1314781 RepID=A0A165H223_EXIGL|nr:2-phosphoglycolate phosphatase [Exidia glandulosa HHB12029]